MLTKASSPHSYLLSSSSYHFVPYCRSQPRPRPKHHRLSPTSIFYCIARLLHSCSDSSNCCPSQDRTRQEQAAHYGTSNPHPHQPPSAAISPRHSVRDSVSQPYLYLRAMLPSSRQSLTTPPTPQRHSHLHHNLPLRPLHHRDQERQPWRRPSKPESSRPPAARLPEQPRGRARRSYLTSRRPILHLPTPRSPRRRLPSTREQQQ